jgi:hypothetical protein
MGAHGLKAGKSVLCFLRRFVAAMARCILTLLHVPEGNLGLLRWVINLRTGVAQKKKEWKIVGKYNDLPPASFLR